MRPLRFPLVQSILALLLAGWLKLCLSTVRWRHENVEIAEAIWAQGGGVIVCFWHSRTTLALAAWPLDRAQEPRVLVSLSPDGEFLSKAVGRLGFPAIRGSSAKKSARDKAKGGASAFRDYAQMLIDNPRYRGALGVGNDARAFAQGLARGGYATDPAYASKLTRLASKLQGLSGD